MSEIRFIDTLPAGFDAIGDDVARGLEGIFGTVAAGNYRATAAMQVGAGIAHPGVEAYGAWENGRLSGILMAYKASPHRAEIAFLHVLGSSAGVVGAALVAHAVERLRDQGMRAIRADSLTFGHVDLDACFRPLGFERTERLLMHRKLSPAMGRADDRGTRPLKPAYIEPAARLLAATYRDHPDGRLHWELQSAEEAAEFIHRVRRGAFGHVEPSYVRAVMRDKALAGTVLGAEILSGTGFVLQLAVRPDARRHGLGRDLLLDLFRAFSQHGLERAALTVSADNPARELYRSVGMEDRAVTPAFLWQASDGDAN